MARKKYTISNLNAEKEILCGYYKAAKKKLSEPGHTFHNFNFDSLDLIFDIACSNRELFPGMNLKEENPEQYIEHWIEVYCSEISNPPSKKNANPKSSCTDPAVKLLVKNSKGLNDDIANQQQDAHILFMSAENALGDLLEEFIASKVSAYGWLWCAGHTLRGIDFCSKDGAILLQVKNKSNTENSSSSSIREGTTIKKWYRLGTTTVNKHVYPSYKWEALKEIITGSSFLTAAERESFNITEGEFVEFLGNVARNNPDIITDKMK